MTQSELATELLWAELTETTERRATTRTFTAYPHCLLQVACALPDGELRIYDGSGGLLYSGCPIYEENIEEALTIAGYYAPLPTMP